ncbi:MAG: TonB-dependent receptor, partial [Kordiimonas sp.]
ANLFDVSSVSPDHAITADPLLLDGIEVLRGAAAARYGGNALNGAVNLIDSKIPKALPESGFAGAAEARYGTGDGEESIAGRMSASLGQIVFHAEGFNRSADNYSVPEEFGSETLKDSFSGANGYSVGTSWVTSKGYIGAAYSLQKNEYGLPGHTHQNAVCHTHGLDLHCVAHGSYEDPFGTPDDHTARIKLNSERVDVRADYTQLIPGIEHARMRLSYTDYKHDEVDGELTFANYVNQVYDGRLELTHAPIAGLIGTFGVQYTDGKFSGLNVNNAHRPQMPPNSEGFVGTHSYLSENFGVFLNESLTVGSVELELALRKDWRTTDITIPEYYFSYDQETIDLINTFFENYWEMSERTEIEKLRADFPRTKYKPFSASLGATWSVNNDYSIALSLAHSERAPSVRELYAKGNNLATNSWEVGLVTRTRYNEFYTKYDYPASNFDLEATNSINLTFRKNQGPTQFEISVFHQDIDNYIFARLHEEETETGLPHKYLFYVGVDATFTGLDGQISHELSENARLTVFGDYVSAKVSGEEGISADLSGAGDNLPRIPPGRLGARYEWDSGRLFVDIEYSHTFGQNKVASYETTTDGYDMVNATVTYSLKERAGYSVEVFLRGTNLLNELAFVHTSFVKDQSPLRGRNLVFGIRTEF